MTTKTRSGPAELAHAVGEHARNVAGMIRRFAVSLTTRGLWQVSGHEMIEGDREVRDAEVFAGIGLFARPPSSGGKPEAVVVFPGGGGANPVIVAARDEATRKAVADLNSDETAIFTSQSIIVIKSSGTIEIRSAVNPLVQSTILGEAYRTAEDTMLTAIASALSALPGGAGTPAIAAINAFKAAAATYLSSVAKVQ